ncbi:trimeric intracellular cation channel family protein [Oceaniglobus ichthyenteri]|uniref:trimeric intracellular cation channel family protein n=1 Tax=Oceaniglobus ichthyenteri TaxID=2136177 RepID=UPI000D334C53|nr:trimeric intracellular cation channel family protein [Oceaniglobus ichthyenteri]
MTILPLLDFAAVFIFALTGALVASRAQLDLIGFSVLAGLTGVGGGSMRDVLLGRDTVFWIAEPTYLVVIGAAAVFIFFTAHLVESRHHWVLWLDAAALAVAVPAGVGVALALDAPPPIVIVMGVITGCAGGLMRDVVANEVPLLLKQGEIYATAAVAGAIAALIMPEVELGGFGPLAVCGIVTFALRGGSLMFGWKLPVYRARPPRG